MLSNFSYLNDLLVLMQYKKVLPIDSLIQGGSRKSGKSACDYEFFAKALLLPTVKIRIYAFRKYHTDIVLSIYEELWNAIENLGYMPFENKTRKLIKYNNSTLTFHALYGIDKRKKKLSGLAGCNRYDYVIVHLEEAYELEEDDINDLREAVRGAKQILWIYSFNPWTVSHWLINKADKLLPFNLEIMKTQYYQFKLVDKTLVHYSNYMVNECLVESDIKQLNDLKTTHPNRALTASYGYPSIEKGAIYSSALAKVSPILNNNICWINAGIDFGFKQDATALIIVGADKGFQTLNVIKEYYHSNGDNQVFKSNETLCYDMINCLLNLAKNYPIMYQGVNIYCDTSNYTMIEILNNLTMKINALWLHFLPCKKLKVFHRVGLQLSIMESERLNADLSCIFFYRELALARWKPGVKGIEVLDQDNHTQDAFHYAFTPWFNFYKGSINKYLLFK